MNIQWQQLTIEQFLREYWQKKPLLLKGGFANFIDPISADELAGLAMEQEVESRIVSHQEQWQVAHGPFEDFSHYGETNWTLLVQAVNHWSADVAELIAPFQFIPNWRIDDVMVSFSCEGGGVGPHLDQYDVFIIQGQGKRRWRVGLPDDSLETLLPHPDLKQVSEFEACIDVITEPGDILYIPPNHPHDGIALMPSLNYSVGFQAPNAQQLWSSFADWLIDFELATDRFADPQREVTTQPHVLSEHDLSALVNFMQSAADNTRLSQVIGRFLTANHHELDLVEPETPFHEADIVQLPDDTELHPILGLKAIMMENCHQLFINGDCYQVTEYHRPIIELLAKNQPFTLAQFKQLPAWQDALELLTLVLNQGYWYLSE
jgi:50S ribosomal protein L16 3-hydroxylase